MPRRFLAPEVVQTSATDCGPAVLKCLLEGFGMRASYGRLREACQTDVDGTSIDTLEEVAVQLGLDAQQKMLPLDYLLLDDSAALPCLIVVRLPGGLTHFVVLWRKCGRWVQLMDPATGRRWANAAEFLRSVHLHEQAVPAAAWREWADTAAFRKATVARLRSLGFSKRHAARLFKEANSAPGWRRIATLDAAIRMTASLASSGSIRRGRQARAICSRFFHDPESLPAHVWSVVGADGDFEEEHVRCRGAVVVSVSGKRAAPAAQLSPELQAALREPPSRPVWTLLKLLREDSVLTPLTLCAGMLIAAAGTLIEALLLRGLFDLGRQLGLTGQRLAALAVITVFAFALLVLELPLAAGVLRLGRQLENRLRVMFLQKIPPLGDRYFQSRPKSDMAERSHSIHRIRHLPELGGRLVRAVFELLFTSAGIIWLDPGAAPIVALVAAAALLLPLLAQPALAEQDLRFRNHSGALTRFYLDALLGICAIRSHGAEQTMRRAHGSLLQEWARAGLTRQRTLVRLETAQLLLGFGLAAALLLDYFRRLGDSGGTLLLVYWALNLPLLAQELASLVWQYPAYRNVTLRLLEPLGALAEDRIPATPRQRAPSRAMALAFEDVSVRASGQLILEGCSLSIEAGSHVAIVGPSGAGKSSFVGLLLGWHRPASGRILVDGERLTPGQIEDLRREIVWVDPEVYIWNQSLLDNLMYGAPNGLPPNIAATINAASLRGLLERLPDGLQTRLGEAGARVSGGEGQRVRLGRAMQRQAARLVILDEPFRGLDRERRRALLASARAFWKYATLLCITHDIGETLVFNRVLVIENGRIVEDGPPHDLAACPHSRYRAMLETEDALRSGLWADACWRRLWLEDGVLKEAMRVAS